jgi:ABC-type sugar transport system substrate-binding protein
MTRLKFLMSLLMQENPYQRQHASTAQQVARDQGVDLEVQFANNDAITQSEQLLQAIHASRQYRPDGIICAPVGTTLAQVAHAAVAAGIGWAVLNREVDYMTGLRQGCRVPVFAVTSDQYSIGQIQCRQIAALLPEGGLVLYVLGPTANSIAQKRLAGMLEAKPANLEVRTLIGDWTEASGYRAVSRWLRLRTSHDRPADLVAGQNDDMVLGAKKAIEEKISAAERDGWLGLPYVGCDCCPGAGRDWVDRGTFTSSVINPPTGGVALDMMIRAIHTMTQPAECTTLGAESYPGIKKLAPRAPRIHPTRNTGITITAALNSGPARANVPHAKH